MVVDHLRGLEFPEDQHGGSGVNWRILGKWAGPA